jgi:tRNA pseudouridine synthase 10
MGKVLLENLKCFEYKFHSGGREDTDVRMLNNGRPFVMEMVNPRKTRGLNIEFMKYLER